MFCPQCGSNQSDEVKFCKLCGSNLHAVRQFMATGAASGKIDWSKTWVAEMLLSEQEHLKRKVEIERLRGLTPEVRRNNEIKAGIITGSVGLGLMIVLYSVMQGIILSGKVPQDTAEILSRIWVAGVIPLFVGLALLINGMFVSKRSEGSPPLPPELAGQDEERRELRAADTTEFAPTSFSVTEGTTKHLDTSDRQGNTYN
jgi:hypothetical protein